MDRWSKGQIAAFIGFIIVIFSIPLGFYLVRQRQDLNSNAAAPKVVKPTPVTKPKEVPATSPLDELDKLSSSAAASLTAALTPTPSPTPAIGVSNVNFGPTLDFKITTEGRPEGKQASKVFVGIAPGATVSAQPKFLLSFTVDVPDSGLFSGLSLAGLDQSSIYTAYIKGPGQIDNAATFSISPATTNLNGGQPLTLLSGDLNEDNTINSADYAIAKSQMGKTSADKDFNSRADFNGDGVINNLDVAFVIKNFGKTGISGTWYSPIPPASSSATPAASASGSPTDNIIPDTASSSAGGYWLWVPQI